MYIFISKLFFSICSIFWYFVFCIKTWNRFSWFYLVHWLPPIHISFLNSCESAPVKFEWYFRCVIFKWIWVIDDWGISCEVALMWMSLDFTDNQSTLVQVMSWCSQATSHYLDQCWPRSLSPYGVTRPQWVNTLCLCGSMRVWMRNLRSLTACVIEKWTPQIH